MKKFHQENLDELFLSSKVAFEGRLLKVHIDTVSLPNGKETTRELIHHPGAVGIVPILDDGSMIFVKQYRYPIDTVLYEIPAGKLDPGEDPDLCAQRELSEETGYSASKWEKLTAIVTTPGFTDEVIHLYAACGLEKYQQHTDEDEFIDIVILTPKQVQEKILNGEIYDSKTLSALYLLQIKKDLKSS